MKKQNHRGIALVLVLWVLVLLSVLAGEFCYSMRTEVRITRNFKERTEAYYIAHAGLQHAILELIDIESGVARPLPTDVRDETRLQPIEWRLNVDIPPIAFGNGRYIVGLNNESGKVNINKAEASLLSAILNRFDLDETEKSVIVDSILDWRDQDGFHRVNGAESDYYLSLPQPYECKDGPFDSIQELLLVRGITPEIFFGGLDRMVTIGIAEAPKKKIKGKLKNIEDFDYNKINVNAASKDLLLAFSGMTEMAVEKIAEFRKEKDFKSVSELLPVVGPNGFSGIIPYISLTNLPVYTVRAVGKVNECQSQHSIEAVIEFDTKIKNNYRIVRWTDRWEETTDRFLKEAWLDFPEQPGN